MQTVALLQGDELSKYWIEDKFSQTDQDSFNEYLPIFINYFLTSSKTIREKDADKDILFYLVQLEKENNVVDMFKKYFTSESATSVYYFVNQYLDTFLNFKLNIINEENTTSFKILPEDASTRPKNELKLQENLEFLFNCAKEEFFEDGIESQFSMSLEKIIHEHSSNAIIVLSNIILSEDINAEIASEALRLVGRIEHPETYSIRLWLLEQSLNSNSARIRDSAVLGLDSIDDPYSIDALKDAIVKESYSELREDMKQVLQQLEHPEKWD